MQVVVPIPYVCSGAPASNPSSISQYFTCGAPDEQFVAFEQELVQMLLSELLASFSIELMVSNCRIYK